MKAFLKDLEIIHEHVKSQSPIVTSKLKGTLAPNLEYTHKTEKGTDIIATFSRSKATYPVQFSNITAIGNYHTTPKNALVYSLAKYLEHTKAPQVKQAIYKLIREIEE